MATWQPGTATASQGARRWQATVSASCTTAGPQSNAVRPAQQEQWQTADRRRRRRQPLTSQGPQHDHLPLLLLHEAQAGGTTASRPGCAAAGRQERLDGSGGLHSGGGWWESKAHA